MAYHTIYEASKLVKRDRRTLYKDIKRGRLTATQSATGEAQVETAELIRAYGEISNTLATEATVARAQEATTHDTEKDKLITLLRAQVSTLEKRLDDKQQHIDHLAQAMQLLTQTIGKELPSNKGSWWPFKRKNS